MTNRLRRNYLAGSTLIKYSNIIVLLFMSCVIGQACRTSKKVTSKEPAKIVLPELKPEEYLAQKIEYKTFSGKASVHMEQKNERQDFTANIRMQKDKSIWASAIALGIAEVARTYITPDSLQAVVRLNKKAYKLSYQEGLELIQAEVPFPVLQNLLIGNPLISNVPVAAVADKDSLIVLTIFKDEYTEVLTFNKENRTLRHLELSSEKRQFKCVIHYEKYGPVGLKQPFAYNRSIVIDNNGETLKLDMEFSKAEIDVPVELPFSIPSSYEKATVKKK